MVIYAKDITFDIIVGVSFSFSIPVSRLKYMINVFAEDNFLLEMKKKSSNKDGICYKWKKIIFYLEYNFYT